MACNCGCGSKKPVAKKKVVTVKKKVVATKKKIKKK